jgi:hypothetical protein
LYSIGTIEVTTHATTTKSDIELYDFWLKKTNSTYAIIFLPV